jgi:hypothetical protein
MDRSNEYRLVAAVRLGHIVQVRPLGCYSETQGLRLGLLLQSKDQSKDRRLTECKPFSPDPSSPDSPPSLLGVSLLISKGCASVMGRGGVATADGCCTLACLDRLGDLQGGGSL